LKNESVRQTIYKRRW